MIRISRGREPVALRDERYVRLARAELAWQKGEPIDFSGYEVAKEYLWRAQHTKCAFCEKSNVTETLPVEHYRPKGNAIRGDGSQDDGYWWLAWSWQNLLYACTSCNNAKSDLFPLEDDARALRPFEAPPGDERPLLVDPASEDPLDEIQFVEVQEGRWWPLPRAGSERGRRTIEITKIKRNTRLTLYENFVNRGPFPIMLDDVSEAIDAGDGRVIRERWQRLIQGCFFPGAEFQALAYCVVDTRFPAEVRTRWRLDLQRPGDWTPSPEPIDRESPHLDGLPPELALRCRALGRRTSREVLRELLRDLCADRARTPGELADLVERETSTVTGHLVALLADHEVVRRADGSYGSA